jgi:uncharacterized membrane protein YgdD (TMEM256/DUF423 family)
MQAMNGIPTHARVLLSIAALALLVATIGGALASHALAGLDEAALRSFTTAVQFLFFHGLGLVALTLVGLRGIGGRWLWLAAGVIVAGTLLFCGSIMARTLGAPPGVVAVAPYGGVLLMLGWVVFALSVWRRD